MKGRNLQPGLTVTLSSFVLVVVLFLLLAVGTIVTLRRDRPRAPAAVAPVPTLSGAVDLRGEVEWVFHDLADLARRHFVQLETAVPTGVRLRIDQPGLRAMLTDAVAGAIRAADGGHVLVAVFTDPQGIEITITDDGPVRDDASRGAALRASAAFLGMRGGGVAIDQRPGQGTTVTLRVPARRPRPPSSEAGRRDKVACCSPGGDGAIPHRAIIF